MRCISLWQPWAHLIAVGAKKIETRSWATGYRGRIGIHAAQKWNLALASTCLVPPFRKYFAAASGSPDCVLHQIKESMTFGAVVAVADLVACDLMADDKRNWPQGDELAFGDYRPGRFMWRLENIERLWTPHTCRGRQQLFEVPELQEADRA